MEKIKEQIKKLKRQLISEEMTQGEARIITRKIKQLEAKIEEEPVI
jgi:hypothetical protein